MTGQALEAISETNTGKDNQQASLSNAVFIERVNEAPSKSISSAELNSDTDISFNSPFSHESSNLIKTAENKPEVESGLEKSAKPNPKTEVETNKGPLGWMIDNPDNPIELPIDKAWKDPYNKITEMGGHERLAKFDALAASVPHELGQIPESERQKVVGLAQRNINPDNPISKADQEELSKYPNIQKIIQGFRDFNADPKFNHLYELRKQVIENLDPAIEYRKQASKWIVDQAQDGSRMEDGRSVTAATLALIIESKSLERYKNGYR